MSRNCPLLNNMVEPMHCATSQCMYLAVNADCLYAVKDTHEYAKQRGIAPADVDRERAKAEVRITAGLVLFEYLEWAEPANVALDVQNVPFFAVHESLGMTPGQLVQLSSPELWEAFQAHHETELRLAQVLLVNEAELEQLQAALAAI